MPQLSLYIDETTLKRVEIAAKLEKLSISKFVVKKLNESLYDSWPENYEQLFGAIDNDSFSLSPQDFKDDTPRETL